MELGAGCGLAGFAASKAGAASVCLTELPENLPRLQELVEANECMGIVSAVALDWTQPLPAVLGATRWDVIIATDCVFWPGLFMPLLTTIAALCERPGSSPRVFLSMVNRLGRAQEFSAAAHEIGWTLQPICQAAAGIATGREVTVGGLPKPQSMEAMRREACELYELRRA